MKQKIADFSANMSHFAASNGTLIDSSKKKIGNKLREKRLEKNYSLKAVARDTGISKSTISEIENGLRHNIDNIIKLACYYGLQLESLVTSKIP